jgi:putative resolvase
MTTLELPGYTVKEAARLIGVTPKTAYNWAKQGRMDFYRDVNGQMRVGYGELYRLLRERESKQIADDDYDD